MTERRPTADALRRLAAPLRGWNSVAGAGLVLGSVALVVGAAAWLARLNPPSSAGWVLATWVIAAVIGALLARLAWRAGRRLLPGAVALGLESSGQWRSGALTALLEPAANGTSPALLLAADRAGAADLDRRGAAALAPIRSDIRRRAVWGVGCLILGVGLIGSADPAAGPAAQLWHPARAWELLRAPVYLRASSTQVDRDGSITLEVEAPGRRDAILWLRSPGEPWHATAITLDSAGIATRRIGPLRADLYARAASGSRESDTLMVHVRLPAFLGSLTVTAHYPRYLGLDAEPLPTGGDTVIVPAGTWLETRGQATADLGSAAWVLGTRQIKLNVDRGGFRGSFHPTTTGEYRLALATADGAALGGDPVRLPLRVVPDSAPVAAIPLPGRDTVAPLDLKVPLLVDVRDDHAVRTVTIVSRRISRLGLADSARTESVPLPGPLDRAVLPFTLDLNSRGLLPGDTVRYHAIAVDNSPRGQTGRSPEYVLRLPTMSELRAAQRQVTTAVTSGLDSLVAQGSRAARATEDLAETQRNMSRTGGESDSTLSYDEAQRSQEAVRQQRALMQRADSVRQALDALRQSAEQSGLDDPAWRQRLDEVERELDRAMTPELQQTLERLQDALKRLDPEGTRAALQQLADAQKKLQDALERSRELFRRAALEGDLHNLAREAKDLAAQQQQWNQQVNRADSARAAAAEQALRKRADSLSAALQKTAASTRDSAAASDIQKGAQQSRQAAQQMNQAAQSAQQGQRQSAQQQGQQAANSLQPLGDQLDQTRQRMQQQWRDEVRQALDRALSETTQLSQQQLELQQAFQRGEDPEQLRKKQAAVEEGVKQLLQQTSGAAGKNALVNPQISTALAAAEQQMAAAREAVSTANPDTREGGDRAGSAVDALNAAAYQLVQAQSDVANARSGSGLSEALEKMSQLAQQQGQLSQQGASLLPMPGGSGLEARLRSLAARQRALGQAMERLRAAGQLPGADALAKEARDLADQLEQGKIDRPTVERQERLFRRMLDAGRTLQGREVDDQKERRSTTARDDNIHLPPALRQRLDQDRNALRVPSWDELQQLSPEERRLVMDYFQRLTSQAAP